MIEIEAAYEDYRRIFLGFRGKVMKNETRRVNLLSRRDFQQSLASELCLWGFFCKLGLEKLAGSDQAIFEDHC